MYMKINHILMRTACTYFILSLFYHCLVQSRDLFCQTQKNKNLDHYSNYFSLFLAIDYYLTFRYLSKKKRCFAACNPLLLHVQYLIIKVWASVCSSSPENCFSPYSQSEGILETRARSFDLSKIFRSCGCFKKNYKGYCVWRGTLKSWPTPKAKRTLSLIQKLNLRLTQTITNNHGLKRVRRQTHNLGYVQTVPDTELSCWQENHVHVA